MVIFIGISIAFGTILLGILFCFIFADRCLKRLEENMPLGEWISFDKAVKLGKSSPGTTQMCLHVLMQRKTVEAQPSAVALVRMKMRADKIYGSLTQEQKSGDVIIKLDPIFDDIPFLEFMLRVRPNGTRKIEEEVAFPDFTVPQAT
jgi:hypothetical protein